MKARDDDAPAVSKGELRAEWREQHLCLRCGHYPVCKMAGALDPNFLVVISRCLAFDDAEPDEPSAEEPR